jgi:Icc protein
MGLPQPAGKRETNPMNRQFRIIQLSDCHVSEDPGARYRGIVARAAFSSVLEQAMAWRPDLLLLTGDLSEDLSEASYRYLARLLEETGAPVITTPGNHDDPQLQARHLPTTAWHEPVVVTAGDWRLIVLNSSIEGEIAGTLTERMLDGLAVALDSGTAPKLVAMHHQPVAVNSHWIDRYPLTNADRLWQLLDAREDVRAVAWGHIHHAFRSRRGGVDLLGAPSTVSNSRPRRAEFEADPAGPACRWLKLDSAGELRTGILRSPSGPWAPSGFGQDQPQDEVDQDAREGHGQDGQ